MQVVGPERIREEIAFLVQELGANVQVEDAALVVKFRKSFEMILLTSAILSWILFLMKRYTNLCEWYVYASCRTEVGYANAEGGQFLANKHDPLSNGYWYDAIREKWPQRGRLGA